MTTHPPSVTERVQRMKARRDRGRERTTVNGWRVATSQCCSIPPFHYGDRDAERRLEPIRLEDCLLVWTPPSTEKPIFTGANMERERQKKSQEREARDPAYRQEKRKQLIYNLLWFTYTGKIIMEKGGKPHEATGLHLNLILFMSHSFTKIKCTLAMLIKD